MKEQEAKELVKERAREKLREYCATEKALGVKLLARAKAIVEEECTVARTAPGQLGQLAEGDSPTRRKRSASARRGAKAHSKKGKVEVERQSKAAQEADQSARGLFVQARSQAVQAILRGDPNILLEQRSNFIHLKLMTQRKSPSTASASKAISSANEVPELVDAFPPYALKVDLAEIHALLFGIANIF